jgi:hypothetical protein
MRVAWVVVVLLVMCAAASFIAAAYLLGGIAPALIVAGTIQVIFAALVVRGIVNGG